MQTVLEFDAFSKQASKLFTEEERNALVVALAYNPLAGDEIPGTGGIRKLRFGAKQKGKRGGARVIYYVFDEDNPLFLLACYGKNEKADLTEDQKQTFRAFTTAIKQAAKERRPK